MNNFKAPEIGLRIMNLTVFEAKFETQQFDKFWGSVADRFGFVAQLGHAVADCEACDMADAAEGLMEIRKRISDANQERLVPLEFSVLANEARHAKNILIREMRKMRFLFVAADRIRYLDQQALFGPDVNDAFQSAVEDIKEAGNCLAAECATGCVFHLMRAAEIALRVLATDRCISFSNKPLDQQEWGVILDALEATVTKMRRDPITCWLKPEIKDVQIRFYNEVIQELRGFNEAWRRHLAHAHKNALYDRDYAASVMGHVKKFMQKLAERISETTIMLPYWDSV